MPERRKSLFHPGRAQTFMAANWQARCRIHDEVATGKAVAMEQRRRLGDAYLAAHAAQVRPIPFQQGCLRADDLVDATRDARAEALSLGLDAPATVDNQSLEFPALGHQFAADGPVLALATAPSMVAPLTAYFGMLPILFNVFVTRAHTTELLPDTAHRFHIDPEDTITHKVFIHLTDVDDGCGPLHVMPAAHSLALMQQTDYREIERIDDDVVAREVGWSNVHKFTGPAGTVAFADTSRCLHFGGRPRDAGKPVRYTLVFQYLLPTSFLFPVDNDWPPIRFMPQLAAGDDETWNALIGATHI